MMNYVAKMPLVFEPGEKWLYGLSHDVMTASNISFRPDLIECAKLDLGFEADVKAMNKNLGKSLA